MVKRYFIPAIRNDNISFMHVGEEDYAAISFSKPHQRADYIIHFIVSGKGIYKTKNDKIETENILESGSAFAIYKYDTVYYHSDEKDPMHYFGWDLTATKVKKYWTT